MISSFIQPFSEPVSHTSHKCTIGCRVSHDQGRNIVQGRRSREDDDMKKEKGRRSRGLRIPGPRRSVPFLLLETQNPRSFPLFIVEVLPVQVINPHIAIAAQISV